MAKDWPDQWWKHTNSDSNSYISVIHHSYEQCDNCFLPLSSKAVFSQSKSADIEEILLVDQRASRGWCSWGREVLQGHQCSAEPFCIPIQSAGCCFPALKPFLSHILYKAHTHFFLPTSSWKKSLILYWQRQAVIIIYRKNKRYSSYLRFSVNNRWGEGKWRPHRSAAIRYSPYKPKAQALCPLFAGRETERRGGGTVPRGAKAEPTTSSRTSTACAAQGYFKQHFQDMEINQHMNESWVFFT